jgi:UDPglucose 6-dehydrogenase
MKIAVVGLGYVGVSNALLLSQHNQVVCLDISEEKVNCINERRCPIDDLDAELFLQRSDLQLRATLSESEAYENSSYVIIAAPTNYNEATNEFDTSIVEGIAQRISIATPQATIIIKSTVPIGFTESLKSKFAVENIIFSPEFLREGRALYDNLYPSRIIVGDNSERARNFCSLLTQAAIKKDIPIVLSSNSEAEAIKLFSNSYLAMRVGYFNEIDNYCMSKGLSAENIIRGVCFDPRIGNHYNNPSFGYGGYCLPKDTKQLLKSYQGIHHKIIGAIVDSNQLRKELIATKILENQPKVVGVHRLIMKENSVNFRESSVLDVLQILEEKGLEIIVFEPLIDKNQMRYKIIEDLDHFKSKADLILANRMSDDLRDVVEKVFTRDLFGGDT